MTTDFPSDKNILLNESPTSPEARATRLRRLRNLANLSRKEMCDRFGIKLDTLIGWEVARHGGLTENGANKIIACVANEGVQCSLEWLMYDIGSGPIVLPNYDKVKSNRFSQLKAPRPISDEDKLIIEDLLHLRTQYRDIIDLVVEDDAMIPQYLPGDHVAGIKHFKNDIPKLIGYDCIMQLTDGKCILRCLHAGTGKNKYTLLCSHTKTKAATPVRYDVELICVAPIIWLRRKNPKI